MDQLFYNNNANWKNIYVNSINGSTGPFGQSVTATYQQGGTGGQQTLGTTGAFFAVNSPVLTVGATGVTATYLIIADGALASTNGNHNVDIFVNAVSAIDCFYQGTLAGGFCLSTIHVINSPQVVQLYMKTTSQLTIQTANLSIIRIS